MHDDNVNICEERDRKTRFLSFIFLIWIRRFYSSLENLNVGY